MNVFYEPTTDSLFYGYSKRTINKTALTNLIIFIEKILKNNPIGLNTLEAATQARVELLL